jgi:hypothetical protein
MNFRLTNENIARKILQAGSDKNYGINIVHLD